MISVITPTIRKEGLPIVEKALKRQTFTDWEWWICSSFDPKCGKWVVDDFTGGIWSLNRAYNRLISNSEGELLVSIQDYTSFSPDALEKFWNHYQNNKKVIVSGVGNKYTDDTWTVKTWQDSRQRSDQGSFYEVYPWDVEGNFCAVPKQVFYDIGGFDEEMDSCFGFDFRGVLERIDMLGGYKFFLDQTNLSYSLEHDRPKGWDENNFINKWADYKKKNIDNGRYPVLKYL